ncbi:unnamed protein product [Phytomonas sp. EM1]|nr:unnamed protein product [Phytomonas sp. EM1]|eukprot:CCW63727.1 unnamed protein product [Phytomonas sp. isolate EM1]
MVALPTQNQLYAFYISRCAHHRVGKPNKQVLDLLYEDELSRLSWQQAEAEEHHISLEELRDIEGDTSFTPQTNDTPLSLKTTFRLPSSLLDDGPVHVGARGMLAILDLIQELPLLEEVDLSNVTSWYIVDASAHTRSGAPDGNAVVKRLCEVAKRLPALRKLDLCTQPIGTMAAHDLLDAIQSCRRLVEVSFCRKAVACSLCLTIDEALDKNREAFAQLPPPSLPETLPPYLSRILPLDRKTLREQQQLRWLLMEDVNFTGAVTEEELSEIVLHARLMSTSEVVWRCSKGGLRGDGVHLFVLKDGSLRAYPDLEGLKLSRGDYFGDTYGHVIMYPSSSIVETDRGVVYAIPLECCRTLLGVWKERVSKLYSQLRSFPIMQVVDTWTRVRLCTCSQVQSYKPEEIVLNVGDCKQAVWIVCSGFFEASAGTMEDKVATGRYEAHRFVKADVFGIESIVARKGCSSVTISAGKEKTTIYSAAVVRGSAIRIISNSIRSVFVSLARPYSLHDDLRRIASKDLERGACFSII